MRLSIVMFLFLFSVNSYAAGSQEFFRDWRLEKPYIHGFMVGLSIGYVDANPTSWKVAHELDPAGIPAGMVQYIVLHKKVPFTAGLITSLVFWLYLTGSVLYRFRIHQRIKTMFINKLKGADDEHHKTLKI